MLKTNHAPRPTTDHGLYISTIFRCCVLGKQENNMCCNSCVHFLKNRLSVSVLIVLGKMRSAIGSAQLLISQKFQQFRELCEENLVSLEHPHSFLFPDAYFDNQFFDPLDIKHKCPVPLHPRPYHWQLQSNCG